jgi:hypothetical protein
MAPLLAHSAPAGEHRERTVMSRFHQSIGGGAARAAASILLACALAGAASIPLRPAAAAEDGPLRTNQRYLETYAQKLPLDVADPLSVLEFVLKSLPDRVKVYPTENYYYFSFVHEGQSYAGNIRLDASDRDKGFVNFGYSEELVLWRQPGEVTFRHLNQKDGVALKKLAPLSYELTFRGRKVIFDLNDLSGVKPPAGLLGEDETYIGPVYDESGVQFFLAFNRKAKVFHYILNEAAPAADVYDPAPGVERVVVGRRTSFAFYRDRQRERKILIGVHEINTQLNNAFDGPFDQLPDNFLVGDTLKDAISEIVPEFRDRMDRFGALEGGEERFAITPYMYYRQPEDLKAVDACIDDPNRPKELYYACFHLEQEEIPDGESGGNGDAKGPPAQEQPTVEGGDKR